MKNLGLCDIDQTVKALEQTIEQRKIQMQNARNQSVSAPVVSNLFSEILKRAGGSYGPISLALEQGGASAQHFINKTKQSVEENPWDALRKIAVFSFGIGLFLSRRHQKSPKGEIE